MEQGSRKDPTGEADKVQVDEKSQKARLHLLCRTITLEIEQI